MAHTSYDLCVCSCSIDISRLSWGVNQVRVSIRVPANCHKIARDVQKWGKEVRALPCEWLGSCTKDCQPATPVKEHVQGQQGWALQRQRWSRSGRAAVAVAYSLSVWTDRLLHFQRVCSPERFCWRKRLEIAELSKEVLLDVFVALLFCWYLWCGRWLELAGLGRVGVWVLWAYRLF